MATAPHGNTKLFSHSLHSPICQGAHSFKESFLHKKEDDIEVVDQGSH